MRDRKVWSLLCVAALLVPAAHGWELSGEVDQWDTAPWRPYDIAMLGDGSVWMTYHDTPAAGWPDGVLVELDPGTGTVTPHSVPDGWGDSGFQTLAVAPDGTLWIADLYDRIAHFDPGTGAFTEHVLPAATFTLPARPFGINVADDGVVWFSCWDSDAIGSYDPATTAWAEYPVVDGADDGEPVDIAFGGGSVWFTTKWGGSVQGLGSLDPGTGTVTLRAIDSGIDPFGVIVDGGDVWFLDHHRNATGSLVRYDTAGGAFEYFDVPADLQDPHFLVMDPDGVIWLTAFGASAIGTFDPATSTFDAYALDPAAMPMGLAIDIEAQEIWWAETRESGQGGTGRMAAREPVEPGIPTTGTTGLLVFAAALAGAALWLIAKRGRVG